MDLGVAERKGRQRAERERRIKGAARRIAEREGWGAVTVRRLAEEIEYSQPVLYSHFQGREAIVAAVAVEGFVELTSELKTAAVHGGTDRRALERVAEAYLSFALRNAALYDAMFTLPTSLRFAEAETRLELRAAFEALASAVAPFRTDGELATETLWATLHGLAALERSRRIRPAARADRVALVLRAIVGD